MRNWQKRNVVLTIVIGLCGLISLTACSSPSQNPHAPERLEAKSPVAHDTDDAREEITISTSLPTSTLSQKAVVQPPTVAINRTEVSSLHATPTMLPSPAPVLESIDIHFIEHGSRQQRFVALTFDLCQDPSNPSGFDEGIYEALVDADAPATFFLGGDWMRTHVDETHLLAAVPYFELGNHSWSHPDFRQLEEIDMSREILRTHELLYQLTGQQSQLFRFPGGTYNTLALSVAAWHGMRSIQWDVIVADPVPDNTAKMILERVEQRVQNGSILVMHANERGWHTAEALPLMIRNLRKENYCLVTVSQLLGLEPLPQACEGEQDFLQLAPGGNNQ